MMLFPSFQLIVSFAFKLLAPPTSASNKFGSVMSIANIEFHNQKLTLD